MFLPRDSKNILDWYEHPEKTEGQGYYMMVSMYLKAYLCSSGNEMRRVHELDPAKWLTGPIWVPLSVEDRKRIYDREQFYIDRF